MGEFQTDLNKTVDWQYSNSDKVMLLKKKIMPSIEMDLFTISSFVLKNI